MPKISALTSQPTPTTADEVAIVNGGVTKKTNLGALPVPASVTTAISAVSADLDAHEADTTGAHAASAISFTPAAGIAATDVQAAIVEDAGDLATHIAATSVHGATALNTASRIVSRNTEGTTAVSGLLLDTAATPTQVAGMISWDLNEGGMRVARSETEFISVGSELAPPYRNASGSTMTSGTVVYITGATGSNTNIGRAKADALATVRGTIGIVTDDAGIANNATGHVCTYGVSHNHDTSAYTAGDILWVSPTTAGALTNVEPTTEGQFKYKIGTVQRAHAVQGEIFVEPEYFGSVTGDAVMSAVSQSAARTAIGAQAIIDTATTPPANQGSTGTKGQRIYASGYVYECVATNTWIRYSVQTTFTT